jgi:hypothetical protein
VVDLLGYFQPQRPVVREATATEKLDGLTSA